MLSVPPTALYSATVRLHSRTYVKHHLLLEAFLAIPQHTEMGSFLPFLGAPLAHLAVVPSWFYLPFSP